MTRGVILGRVVVVYLSSSGRRIYGEHASRDESHFRRRDKESDNVDLAWLPKSSILYCPCFT